MEATSENIAAILEMIEELEAFKAGYPPTPRSLLAYCRGVCEIIQDQPQLKTSALESCRWLVDRATRDFYEMPTVIDLYDKYATKFRPADQGPVDMAEVAWAKANHKEKS